MDKANPNRAKLKATLDEAMALLKQDPEYEGCLTVRVAFCLGSGLISVQGSVTKDDVQYEDWLVQRYDDYLSRRTG
jgi:hypothetical protein